MKLKLTSVPVDDQTKAHAFYTETLAFIKVHDLDMGGGRRWLTVESPEEQGGTQLLLEPMAFEPAKVYQKALFDAGVPCNSFQVDDIEKEYKRLTALGVLFKMNPTKMGTVTVAMFDDTCGNYIQLMQV